MSWVFLWGEKMPLPNILEFIGTNVTQAGFKAAQKKLLNFLSEEAATKVELSAAVTPKADKTYVDSALTSFQNGAIKTYPTLSAANADIANIALNTKVSVLSETDGGDYYKASASATSLTKSAYDPLTQAKLDATAKDNEVKGYVDGISVEKIQFPAGHIKIFTGSYNLTTNTVEFYAAWKSFKYKLSGKEIQISGKFAAYYNGLNGAADNIKLPAVAFFDKDAKLISYILPIDATNGKAYDLTANVPKNADYVLLSYCTASVNNLPANISDYGVVTVSTEKTLSNSTDVNALDLVQQNGLVETNEKTILLNKVVKNPILLMGKEGVYAFDSVYQNWFSYRIDLSGYLKITGKVSAHRSASDSVYVPALVIYDSNDNVVDYFEHSNDLVYPIDINTEVTSNMAYAIANVDISVTGNNLILTKSTGSIPIAKSITNLRTIVEDNGLVDLNILYEELTGKVNDAVVYTGDSGNYVKTNTYEAWYALRIDLANALKVSGAGSYYNNGSIRIPAVVVFNSSDQVVKYYEFATQQPTTEGMIGFNFDVTPDMAYMYIQYQNLQQYPYIKVEYSTKVSLGISQRIDSIESELNLTLPKLSLLTPNCIYNVANDIDFKVANQDHLGARSALKRNFSSVIYLDNFIEYVSAEPSICFDNGGVKKIIPAYSPWIEHYAIENPNLNGGQAIYSETVDLKITGNSTDDQIFPIVNRSVLNSASKDKTPTILIIGDSVSFGQDAYFAGGVDKWNYTMILNKMFAKDKSQNNGSGYNFRTVGTVSYTDKDGIKSFNEAYSGTTLDWFFNYSKFLDAQGNFSFQNWLDKYRTCDDNGNRLYINQSQSSTGTVGSSNIGYLADGSDSGFIIGSQITDTMFVDVYKPTHVFCFHASNSPVSEVNYNLFISRVKSVFPDAIIGLGVPRVAGTFFPSKYPNIVDPEIWKYDQGYNNNHVATLKVLINSFWNSTQEANKVFVLPTFWVNPAAEAFSSIYVNSPDVDLFDNGDRIEMPVGQRRDVHVGSKAQAAYAYQLYAWLKWTAANALF